MRRTLERSQRLEQRQKRWSWSGLSDSDSRNGMSTKVESFLVSLTSSIFLLKTLCATKNVYAVDFGL